MLNRLVTQWVYGGSLAGLLLLLLAPILTRNWPMALMLVYLCLPAYMLHQFEEHDNDRFRSFVNRRMFHGRQALTSWDVFVINVPGVWGVIAVALALAANVSVGFGLIAVYLMLVNAVSHIGGAIAKRGYNPGLLTAIFVFLPLGVLTLNAIRQAGGGTIFLHAFGVAVSLAIHAGIVAVAFHNARQSPSAQ